MRYFDPPLSTRCVCLPPYFLLRLTPARDVIIMIATLIPPKHLLAYDYSTQIGLLTVFHVQVRPNPVTAMGYATWSCIPFHGEIPKVHEDTDTLGKIFAMSTHETLASGLFSVFCEPG